MGIKGTGACECPHYEPGQGAMRLKRKSWKLKLKSARGDRAFMTMPSDTDGFLFSLEQALGVQTLEAAGEVTLVRIQP